MFKSVWRLVLGASIAAATFGMPAAQAAVVIDFEDPAIAGVGLFLPGDSFSQSGFTLTVDFDFGLVDNSAGLGLGLVTPTGDDSHYYFQSNQGGLIVAASDGKPFSLDGFDAAYVPLIPGPPQTTVLLAFAEDADGNLLFGTAFPLGSGDGTAAGFPFLRFKDPADFASFTNVRQVEFFACANTGQPCQSPADNNAQFGLDNIVLTPAVPEPSTTLLMTVGLLGLAGGVRRRREQRATTR